MSVSRVCALAVIACAVFVQAAQAGEMVSVVVPKVTLRSGPGAQHEGTWSVVQGYPLQVTGRKGAWLKVKDFENDSSWVNRSAVGKAPYVIVKVRGARLRDKPSANGRAVGMVQYGQVLPLEEKRKGWVQVRSSGHSSAWLQSGLVWGM